MFFFELFALLRALRLRRACPASLLPTSPFLSTMAAERGSVQYHSTGETTEWEVSFCSNCRPPFSPCWLCQLYFRLWRKQFCVLVDVMCCTLHGFPSCPLATCFAPKLGSLDERTFYTFGVLRCVDYLAVSPFIRCAQVRAMQRGTRVHKPHSSSPYQLSSSTLGIMVGCMLLLGVLRTVCTVRVSIIRHRSYGISTTPAINIILRIV